MKSQNEARNILKNYTEILLSGSPNWHEKREVLQLMHRLFVSLGAFDSEAPSLSKNDIWLDGGCAISPTGAGRCIFEISRTRLFVTSLVDAIHAMQKKTANRPIQVLDAGCGPYALLSLLAALFFEPGEVEFHLIDIHEINLSSAATLINALDMQPYFGKQLLEDASKVQWADLHQQPLHIVVTEVMLNALRKEPQVAVTLNLAKQLVPDGILIPQKVDVDLVQVHMKKEWASKTANIDTTEYVPPVYEEFEAKLGTIAVLDKQTSEADITRSQEIVIPADFDQTIHSLQLHTTITVFNEHVLDHNDTSLTMPFLLSRLCKTTFKPGDVLTLRYQIHPLPGVRCTNNLHQFAGEGE